ncbi:xaa-Pro aminopeptidase 1-like [Panulirus ornatus]|uniref:xaa-Pro aminopeptidase 1-like n=1 Tax=Panulirus ornatus TaxID=150431 RepID=UPI003A846DE0
MVQQQIVRPSAVMKMSPTVVLNAVALVLFLGHGSGGTVVRREYPDVPLDLSMTLDVTLDDRYNCGEGDPQPPNRVDTAERVARLRQEIANYGLDAYIIPTSDAHQNEFVAPADQRRNYISGFSGSSGVAVVTMSQQALWTDGRYFLQADEQLDCHWLLMKSGLPGVPSLMTWLQQVLPTGSRVGADPTLFSAQTWESYALSQAPSIEVVAEETNLVDVIWTDRPPYSTEPAFVLGMEFAGKSWEDKVMEVRGVLSRTNVDALVVTTLDEVAWLLNLRGHDIPYNPVFRSYVLVTNNSVTLYTPADKVTPEVESHLHAGDCATVNCVTIRDYDAILDDLSDLEYDPLVSRILVSLSTASYSIYSAIPSSKSVSGVSTVMLLKAKKNEVEIRGMKNAHVKDAVALCDFLAFMEREVTAGNPWDELSASDKLQQFRAEQEHYFGLSFTTISAFGPNGAVIHYFPEPETNLAIDASSTYVLDSGVQYKDGTTDVTRTLHYGEPTAFQVDAYTRVLKGQLDFAAVVFPVASFISYWNIDILARRNLYEVGLDYRHGTSHGVGMFLFVHEATTTFYEVGEFMSDEPGYYEDGEFGIRLENVVTVVEAETPHVFSGKSLTFEAVTLVPYEPKLINTTMLTRDQCAQMNAYNIKIRDVVGREMVAQGRQDGYEWLLTKTQPLDC